MSAAFRLRLGIASALSALCLGFSARADEPADSVPRYRLQAGQELKYQGSSDFHYENGSFGSKDEWQAWVLQANNDGSWRVVVRLSRINTSQRKGQEQADGHPDVTLAYCDVFPDGRIAANESIGYTLDPSVIFPKLPDNEMQVREGWSAEGLKDDSRSEYEPLADSVPGVFVFEGDRHSEMDQIYLSSSHAKYTFDRKRGFIQRIDSKNEQGYGFNGKGTGTSELVGLEQHDDAWTRKFQDETSRYFAADKAYQDLQARASKEADRCEALLAEAETALKDVRSSLTIPELQKQVDQQLRGHKGMLSYYKQEAENRGKVMGKSAEEWDTTDLEGKPYRLKDLRGKVVVLDFWYRGCGWCIRAMPQMKQLAEDFKDRPVAILGMNTDSDEKDAKFVAETMKLNYPSLKARGIPEKYHVRGFPTLIIVDQEGKVADVHVGYSPKLREEVGKAISSLLEKK